MLRIDITSFESGVHSLELSPDVEDLELDPDTFEDIHVAVRLDCHRDRILVNATVRGVANLTCDRTLQDYQQPLVGEYSVLFGPERLVGAESDNFDEVQPFDPSAREIDITEVVRDTLLLAVPQRKVAPGAEEEEIQTEFGAPGAAEDEGEQQDIDPRWEALRKLKERGGAASN